MVGTWTISGGCYDLSGVDITSFTGGQCPSASVSPSVQAEGTLAVQSDGTYHVELSVSGSIAVSFPVSCLPNGLTDCAQLDNAARQVTCTGAAATGCTCSAQVTPVTDTEDGTWTTSGSVFSTTPANAGATPGVQSYCVQGSTWTLHQDGTSVQPGITVVATRQ